MSIQSLLLGMRFPNGNIQTISSTISEKNYFEAIARNYVEVLFEIYSFLSHRDIVTNQKLSKYFKNILSSQRLWRLLVWRDIIPVQFAVEVQTKEFEDIGEAKFIQHVMETIQTPIDLRSNAVAYFTIYRSFYRFSYRILGYYRRLKSSNYDFRGELDIICISPVTRKLVFQSFTVDEVHITSNASFPLLSIGGDFIVGEIDCIIKSMTSQLRSCPAYMSYNSLEVTPLRANIPFTIHKKLVNPTDSEIIQDIPNDVISIFSSCLGLKKGMYGPHGMELLQVFIHPIFENEEFGNTAIAGGYWQLHGLKIIGDPNVPANQLSFCIDLMKEENIAQLVEQDRRACLNFDINQNHNFFDIRSRQKHIIAWRRGTGQINSTPYSWSPEWRNVNFIVYNPKYPFILPHGRVAFSVIFDDPRDSYRHVIDYLETDIAPTDSGCTWL